MKISFPNKIYAPLRHAYVVCLRGHYVLLLATVVIALLTAACASMGTPSGGPRDEDPPRLLHVSPAPGATGFGGSEVVLTFDELVNVKDAFSKVVVSPPGGSAPRVTSSGHRVYVHFPDTLRSNTTYTIDFGNSIEDNNEANPLGALSLSFSTGSELDSMRISGVALDAYTLEPQQYMLVGVHRADAPDSALARLPFERVTKTDDRGRFTIRGLKSVPYMLYALGDVNNDYRRDSRAELLAFYPHAVIPYAEQALTTDTIYNLTTGRVDTIVERPYTRFLPNNLLLSVFDEGYKPQYLVKYERPDSARLRFIFNAPNRELPEMRIINMPDNPAYRLEHTAGRDTLDYWLVDPRFVSADTLRVSLAYFHSDPQGELAARTDTLTLTKPRVVARKGKRSKAQLRADSIADAQARLLGVTLRPGGAMQYYERPGVEFAEPLLRLDSAGIRLEIKQDSLWLPVPVPALMSDTLSAGRKLLLEMTPEYGATYRLTVDTLSAQGVSGRFNPTVSQQFTVKKREDYVSLTLRLQPDTIPGFVEVLNSGDNVVMRAEVKGGIATFPWLAPADYYARFVADADSSGAFTPGDYASRRQPEDVFYYPTMISLKRHDRSELWNLYGTPVDAQKPRKLLKNKPEAGKRRAQEETEDLPEDDTFDVNANPFDPASSRRTSRSRAY